MICFPFENVVMNSLFVGNVKSTANPQTDASSVKGAAGSRSRIGWSPTASRAAASTATATTKMAAYRRTAEPPVEKDQDTRLVTSSLGCACASVAPSEPG